MGTNTGDILVAMASLFFWETLQPNLDSRHSGNLPAFRDKLISNVINVIYTPYMVYPHPCFQPTLFSPFFLTTYRDLQEKAKAVQRKIYGTLYKRFQKIKEERTVPNPFNEPSITLIPKPKILQQKKHPNNLNPKIYKRLGQHLKINQ